MPVNQYIPCKFDPVLQIFFRVGDIYALSPIFATLYAIVSKAQTFQFTDDPMIQESKTPQNKGLINP